MRLINVYTRQLEEFAGDSIPQYAILSHTWGDEEVTFQEWNTPADNTSRKSGFNKIVCACEQAKDDGLWYLWSDTNCIDKTSSAELSEAINSMFHWYHNSAKCYAYLEDVFCDFPKTFKISRWMKRGWTLQELLAPGIIWFFDRDWKPLGDRDQLSLKLSQATRIPVDILTGKQSLLQCSVAQKMSWLSPRKTTRVEDMAYCMLGVLDINLPPLYGEGQKAFIRLQEELVRVSGDETLLCWSWTPAYVPRGWSSLLAPCPQVFAECHNYVQLDYSLANLQQEYPEAYSISNGNLHMRLCGIETWGRDVHIVSLNAARADLPGIPLSLPLQRQRRPMPFWPRSAYPSEPIPLKRRVHQPSVYINPRVPNDSPARSSGSSGYPRTPGILFLISPMANGNLVPRAIRCSRGHWMPSNGLFILSVTSVIPGFSSENTLSFGVISFEVPDVSGYGMSWITIFLAMKKTARQHEFYCTTMQNPRALKQAPSSYKWENIHPTFEKEYEDIISSLRLKATYGQLGKSAVYGQKVILDLSDDFETFIDGDGRVVQVVEFNFNY